MHGKAPKGIITDQCLGIRAGIENVMPETRNRLCIWHITKKIPEKFKRHKRYKELQSDLNNIVWESISKDDFQNQWKDFLIEYGLEDNKWLSVSTSKVYSILEDVSTFKERVYEVNYNAKTKDITCMCQMFESRGILCRHSLVVLRHERVREIPRRYILDRWSKLVKRRHSDIKSSHDPSLLNPKIERFDDLCSHSNSVAQFASQTKKTSDILHRYLDMAMAECQKHVANSSSNANELDNLLTLEDGGKDGGKDALSIFVGGCIISIQDIKSPPYVSTKGRPTNRLGSEKDKMIKKKTEAKKRKSEITEKEIHKFTHITLKLFFFFYERHVSNIAYLAKC
ncbi:hypothetical protein AHAS_Ahas19G0388500 [Arachis hypogaea]